MRNVIASLLLIGLAPHGWSQEPVDEQANEILRKHGLEQSQVMDHLSWMCDVYGPRLTGSPNLRKAQRWAAETLTGWGLKNAALEEWGEFGRGWHLDGFSIRVVGDNPWPVHGYPKAWTPSLSKTTAEVVSLAGKSREEIEAMDLTGKIVLMDAIRDISEPFDGTARRFDSDDLLDMANQVSRGDRGQRGTRRGRSSFMRRGQLQRIVFGKNPLALMDRGSKGQYGTIFVSRASVPRPEGAGWRGGPSASDKGAKVTPQFTLSVEHYNRLVRLADKGMPVKMELSQQSRYFEDDLREFNVVAEIPGTDLKDEVVMLGAHFDSWHSGTGASDNGCGSATMMEAVRLITKVVEARGAPRRTIRIALWSGEEQGLLGSRAYVKKHFAESGGRGQPVTKVHPAHAKLSGYFNMDNGTGKVRGVYLQGNEGIAPIFRAWLKPFHDLGASTLTLNNTGGTDHLAFDGVGLPGFQFIQDPVAYSTQTHHSNMDNWDHAVAEDLKQASTIIASFVWHAAQRDMMLPRKPARVTEERRSGSPGNNR